MYSKERFAQEAISRGLENATAEEALLALYDAYYKNGNEDALRDIALHAETLGKNNALKVLRTSSHFKWDDYEDYLQLIAMKLFQKIRNERQIGKRQNNIVYTVRRFYHLRAKDITDWLAVHRNGKSPLSLDDLNETDDGKTVEVIGKSDPPADDDFAFDKEKDALFRRLNHLYLGNILNYSEEPQRPIALLYSRFLYQLEMRNNPNEMDHAAQKIVLKDKRKIDADEKWAEAFAAVQEPATTTSVKWAMRRMERKTMKGLSDYAQLSIREYYSPHLAWSAAYINALEESSPYKPGTAWKDIIYTEQFTSKKTSYWSDWLHDFVCDQMVAQIEADPELDEEVMRIDSPIKTLIMELRRRKTHDASDER